MNNAQIVLPKKMKVQTFLVTMFSIIGIVLSISFPLVSPRLLIPLFLSIIMFAWSICLSEGVDLKKGRNKATPNFLAFLVFVNLVTVLITISRIVYWY